MGAKNGLLTSPPLTSAIAAVAEACCQAVIMNVQLRPLSELYATQGM
jgi:hypothetical protein